MQQKPNSVSQLTEHLFDRITFGPRVLGHQGPLDRNSLPCLVTGSEDFHTKLVLQNFPGKSL